jgi:hypothetical protein
MLSKALLGIVALVGGYASLTGTLPAVMVALFGNPDVFKTTGNDDALLLVIGLSPILTGVDALDKIEKALGI